MTWLHSLGRALYALLSRPKRQFASKAGTRNLALSIKATTEWRNLAEEDERW